MGDPKFPRDRARDLTSTEQSDTLLAVLAAPIGPTCGRCKLRPPAWAVAFPEVPGVSSPRALAVCQVCFDVLLKPAIAVQRVGGEVHRG